MTAAKKSLDGDQTFVSKQYADSRAFLVRVETHRKYSERTSDTFGSWLMAQLEPASGMTLADVGCGPGLYHAGLARSGVKITAVDTSPGMIGEARQQASDGDFIIDGIVASAEALPLSSGIFDRVMANHMLYHVPDQPRALAELHRIAKPGARVVLATNAANNIRGFYDVHVAAARGLGYSATGHTPLRFSLDDMPLVQAEFPNAEVRVREDALIFTDTDGATRYYMSYLVDSIEDRPTDNSHRRPLIDAFRQEVEAVLAREGTWRVQKDAGCFVATA